MPLTVTLEFSDAELEYFRSVMHRVRSKQAVRSPFILRRIDRVARLVAMLEDPEWQLPDLERARVLDGLAYVAEAHDLVPDNVPVLGLLDDAVMLELVLRELQHELESYEEFDQFRLDEAARRDKPGVHRPVSRDEWLRSRREALHTRMRERRERDLARDGTAFQLITRF